MRAPFHEREHAPADEVHLEAEQIVLVARGGRQRVNARLNLKEARDKAADMRRHRHEQVGQGDRRQRVRRRAVRLPVVPQRRGVGFDVLAEALVERSEALGVVQVTEDVPGYSGCHAAMEYGMCNMEQRP